MPFPNKFARNDSLKNDLQEWEITTEEGIRKSHHCQQKDPFCKFIYWTNTTKHLSVTRSVLPIFSLHPSPEPHGEILWACCRFKRTLPHNPITQHHPKWMAPQLESKFVSMQIGLYNTSWTIFLHLVLF